MLSSFVTPLLAVIIAAQVLLVAYLLSLAALAVVARPPYLPLPAGRRKFCVLVPAHDEEAVVARLLRSLLHLDYSRDLFDVCVVADNCSDSTAQIARSFGVRLYERFDTSEQAKGYALRWLLKQLEQEHRTYDAYVVVDADSVVAPNFLRAMDARLEHGAHVIQAYYTVLNPAASALAALRTTALAAIHYLRPLGRSQLGLSAGLKGNGMCFSADVLKRFAWRWFTLAEDVEFHLALVEQGIGVEFAPETWVKGDMPVTLKQATSQNARWERGRLELLRTRVPRLLWTGLRQRRWLLVDATVEQVIPPLSVPFAVAVAATLLAIVLGSPSLALVASASLAGYVVYLLVGLALVRAPLRMYASLSMAPIYVAWKLGVYVQSFLASRTTVWVRTARTPTAG
ncbi:MAG: glycosyltransferase [Chloroflexi bacterium]|nr:glycosyltransferase [Chloroflexota bacterium]MBV9547041.1 glycosyltransferase [Chloroflexota bacterium]